MTIKYGDEIFSDAPEAQVPVIWWLVHLLGGQVVIPEDAQFWLDNYPKDASLVMYKENGKMILAAERLDEAGN
jgi:hypothetical protein